VPAEPVHELPSLAAGVQRSIAPVAETLGSPASHAATHKAQAKRKAARVGLDRPTRSDGRPMAITIDPFVKVEM
jgi:hypothetical protein